MHTQPSTPENDPASPYKRSFVAAKQVRHDELTALIDALSSFDSKSSDKEEFTELFQMAVQSLELSDDKLADILDTTRTTIVRWVHGKNAPSRSARKSVFSMLLKEAKKKLKRRKSVDSKVAA